MKLLAITLLLLSIILALGSPKTSKETIMEQGTVFTYALKDNQSDFDLIIGLDDALDVDGSNVTPAEMNVEAVNSDSTVIAAIFTSRPSAGEAHFNVHVFAPGEATITVNARSAAGHLLLTKTANFRISTATNRVPREINDLYLGVPFVPES